MNSLGKRRRQTLNGMGYRQVAQTTLWVPQVSDLYHISHLSGFSAQEQSVGMRTLALVHLQVNNVHWGSFMLIQLQTIWLSFWSRRAESRVAVNLSSGNAMSFWLRLGRVGSGQIASLSMPQLCDSAQFHVGWVAVNRLSVFDSVAWQLTSHLCQQDSSIGEKDDHVKSWLHEPDYAFHGGKCAETKCVINGDDSLRLGDASAHKASHVGCCACTASHLLFNNRIGMRRRVRRLQESWEKTAHDDRLRAAPECSLPAFRRRRVR